MPLFSVGHKINKSKKNLCLLRSQYFLKICYGTKSTLRVLSELLYDFTALSTEPLMYHSCTKLTKLVSTLPKQPVSLGEIISQNSYWVSGRNEYSFQQVLPVLCSSDLESTFIPETLSFLRNYHIPLAWKTDGKAVLGDDEEELSIGIKWSKRDQVIFFPQRVIYKLTFSRNIL